jgi:hypothetical protein
MSSYYRTYSFFRIGEKSSSDIDMAHGLFVEKKRDRSPVEPEVRSLREM